MHNPVTIPLESSAILRFRVMMLPSSAVRAEESIGCEGIDLNLLKTLACDVHKMLL
jgi:hypothetical protein